MSMISVAATVFDPHGHVVLDALPESETREITRRVNRVPTLGLEGAVVNDAGHFAADRTWTVAWMVSGSGEYERVARMVRLHSRLLVSNEEGAFLAAPQRLNIDEGKAELVLLILEKIS